MRTSENTMYIETGERGKGFTVHINNFGLYSKSQVKKKRMTLSQLRICVMIKLKIIAHTQTDLCSKYSVYKCLELWKL